MFKNRFLLVLGVFSLLLVTMAISRPFSNASVPTIEGPNDFYQRHRDWNRNLEASDYYERHPEFSGSAASIVDIAGDFALRHPEWTISVQNASLPVTGILETSDYFQRHPTLGLSVPAASTADLTDYFLRHPELRTPNTIIDLSDYFLRH
jgi:hypothetical protein